MADKHVELWSIGRERSTRICGKCGVARWYGKGNSENVVPGSRGVTGVGSLPERELPRVATRPRFRKGWVDHRRFGITALIKLRGTRVMSHDTVMSLL